jgi:methionyl-tRNA synthetase
MPENILVAVAWPYASGPLHLGHIAGAYLPADIFARYHRLKGNRVLMVSGSDQHGTPITVKAEQLGKTPQELVAGYHQVFLDCWRKLGISFDLFTTTGTANHAEVTHDIFRTLLEKGYIYRDSTPQAYCPECERFLPDRYVEGTCPVCGFVPARGDQCDSCGRPLDPAEIADLRCRICGTRPRFETTEHFFLKLSAFEKPLQDWIKKQTHWRQNVHNFTEHFLAEGLKDRAITRDIDWGVTVPVAGFDRKRIYVWFEAVIGYLSASKEWAKERGNESAWKPFWNEEAKSYYFIGKDNIFFHSVIWPAMLMGYGGLRLPYDVPANEFLTVEGKKLSTSRNWAVWLPDYLERYAPDPLRYMMSINMPETNDTDFSWSEFLRKNNDELVATYGNLAHRTLTFTQRNFAGTVPEPGILDELGQALITRATRTVEEVGEFLARARFKDGIKTAMALAAETNRYLDHKAPWKAVKTDRASAGATVFVVVNVLAALKTALYPFLPFSSAKLHTMLGFPGMVDEGVWTASSVPAGRQLPPPEPLFLKLDDSIVAEETARLGQPYNL